MPIRVILGIALALAAAPAFAQLSIYSDLGFSRYKEAVAAAEKAIKENPEREPALLPPLCYAYYKLRRYDRISSCAAAIEQRVRSGNATHSDGFIMRSDLTPFPAMLRASMDLDFGQYEKALSEGEAALALVKDEAWGGGMMAPLRYRIEILPTLGTAAALLGDAKRAESYARQLEEISLGFTGAAMGSHRDAALGRIYMALKRCDKVLEYASKGEQGAFIRAAGDLLMGGGSDSLKTQFDLSQALQSGKCLAETGKTKEAENALDYVVRHPRAPVNAEVFWLALFERGRVAEKQGDTAGAIGFYRRAVDVIEEQRASINAEASKIGFVGDKQAVYEHLIRLLIEQQRAPEAFDYVERSKARALVDLLAGKKDFAAPGLDPQRTRAVLAQLDAADLASRSDAASPQGKAGARSAQAALSEIRKAAPEFSTLVAVSSVPLDELKALIAEDEALVEYYYGSGDLYAFVVSRDGLSATRLQAGGLADAVQSFRASLQDPGSAAWQEGARSLYKRLWEPLQPRLGAANVVVVPHGVLHYLPFGVLRAEDGKLLIEERGLRFLPSASVLKFLKPAAANKGALLLSIGNPDLGDARLDLKFAEDEARAVAKLYPQSRLLLRKEASESNLKKAGGVFSRIHFATHGRFEADDPLSSGLYLAKDAEDDGVLTVGELYSMKLDADLVTLSACETGLGKVANGDDVVGLTRGFLYAGSRSIVASLWSVDDRATAKLMEAFYANLATMPKLQALRAAQLATRAEFPHPFFWAAFELTGRRD